MLGAGIVYWVFKKKVPAWVKWLSLIFFAAAPIVPIYAIALVKDSVFSLLLVIMVIFIYEMILNERNLVKGNRNILFSILFVIDIAGLIILRNNGSYIIIPCLFFLFIFVKRFRKLFLVSGAVTAALMVSISAIHNHYSSEKLFQEAVGIPLQQVAATVANDGVIGEEEKKAISNIMDPELIKKEYNPQNADYIKWHTEFNRNYLNEHKQEFLKTWLKLLPQNASIYLKAYVDQTYWFWVPDPRGTVQTFTTIYQTDNPWLPPWQDENGIHDDPVIKGPVGDVLKAYYGLSKYFLREGILFWIMIASLIIYRIRSRNRKAILIYLPLLMLWGTIMISTPINQSMRYVFAFVYALVPIYIGLMFIDDKADVRRARNLSKRKKE